LRFFNPDQRSATLAILITARFTQAHQLASNSRSRSHSGSNGIFSSDNRNTEKHTARASGDRWDLGHIGCALALAALRLDPERAIVRLNLELWKRRAPRTRFNATPDGEVAIAAEAKIAAQTMLAASVRQSRSSLSLLCLRVRL
jgi:hypothetical protein